MGPAGGPRLTCKVLKELGVGAESILFQPLLGFLNAGPNRRYPLQDGMHEKTEHF